MHCKMAVYSDYSALKHPHFTVEILTDIYVGPFETLFWNPRLISSIFPVFLHWIRPKMHQLLPIWKGRCLKQERFEGRIGFFLNYQSVFFLAAVSRQ